MQQKIEQHFRTAEHFGLKTEGKDLKEVRKEITIIEEAKKRECMENSTSSSYTNRRKNDE